MTEECCEIISNYKPFSIVSDKFNSRVSNLRVAVNQSFTEAEQLVETL